MDTGVCGYLNLNNEDYSVPVPNITEHLEDQLSKIK